MLERSAMKVARSVLRGLEVGNDLRLLDLMNTVEIFRLDMFGLDAYLVQSEENKKSQDR